MDLKVRPPTILIADDYDDNRELLRVLLTPKYDVREAQNGLVCLEMAREQQPDLIMVDLSMPGLDGWGLLLELKDDLKTAKIPCVAVTAHGESDRQRALAAGFDGYLSKPFRSSELFEIVSKLISSAAPQTEVC